MNVTVTDISETRKKLTAVFNKEEVAAEERKIMGEFLKHARLPGFRPGKAPPGLVRSRYAKEVDTELKHKLIAEAYKEGKEQNSLNIYGIVEAPGAAEWRIERGGETKVPLTVDIVPDFNLPEYKDIPAELPPPGAREEEIDQAIENLRRERSEFKAVDRAARQGDYVRVTYRGMLDGQPVAEILPGEKRWSAQENTWEEAGEQDDSYYGVPAVTKALAGMKAGDKKEAVPMDFPGGFSPAELAGKKVLYDIEVSEVRERILPEADEAFLKNLGVDSAEALRQQLRGQIEDRKKEYRSQLLRQQVSDALLERIEFPIPELALEEETQRALRRIMTDNIRRGVPEEQFEQHKDELLQSARRSAARRVKLEFILSRIADKESVKVEEDDLKRAIAIRAMASQRNPRQVLQDLRKDEGALQELQRAIRFDKTLAFLMDAAKVVEKEEKTGETT